MSIESNTQKQSKPNRNKLILPIIIAASVLVLGGVAALLFGLGVFQKQEAENTEVPTEIEEAENEPVLWWNVERLLYGGKSDIGTSSRKTDPKDGFFHVLFASEGRQVTRRVAEKKIVNVIDSNDLMALTFDEKGIITGVKRIEDCTGGFEIFGRYITEVFEDRAILTNTSQNMQGLDEEYDIPETAVIYDVSGVENYVGMEIPFSALRPMDRVYAVKNLEGEIYRVFVTERYQEPQVYWNISRQYDSTILATKRKPNADGEYEIMMAHNNEQVLIKTKSRDVATAIDKQSAKCLYLSFDADGYCVDAMSASNAYGGTFASWYNITEIEGNTVKCLKVSSDKNNGKTAEGVLAQDYRVYDVSGCGAFIGEQIYDLRATDKIHAIKNKQGEISVIFVVGRVLQGDPYWNVKRMYDKTNLVSTRKKSSDGYYHFTLAHNGVQGDYYTDDLALVNTIDAYPASCFGLQVEEKKIVKAFPLSSCFGGSTFSSWYEVVSIEGNQIKTYKKSTGQSQTGTLSENIQIYNVCASNASVVGEKASSLRVGDIIHGCTDWRGEVSCVYIITRKEPDITAFCEECGHTVVWKNLASGKMEEQKDASGKVLAVGHFYVAKSGALSSQLSTPYKKTTSGTTTTYTKTQNVHIDLRGHNLTASDNARFLGVFGKGAEVVLFDSKKTGTIKASNGADPKNNGSFIWVQYENSKIKIKNVKLDMSGSRQESVGGIYITREGQELTLENVTIKGGHAKTGSVIYASNGTVTLNNVTVTGGNATKDGTIAVLSKAKLILNGNVSVTGGSPANIYLAAGRTIDTTGLSAEGGSIFVTVQNESAFTTKNFAGLAEKFKADQAGATVVEKSGALYVEYTYTGIAFDQTEITVPVGTPTLLQAHTLPVATNKYAISYESSDPAKVEILDGGQVIGLAKTETPVTVTAKLTIGEDTMTATVQVTVTEATGAMEHYHPEATKDDIDASTGTPINYTAWTSATSLPKTSGYYYLTTDVTLAGQFELQANQGLHICLNGHTVKGTTTRTISLHNEGCTFGLCDCQGTGKVEAPEEGSPANQGRGIWARYGTFNFYGGTIVGYKGTFNSAANGIAVNVSNNATMNMYGGTITGSVANQTEAANTALVLMGGNVAVKGILNLYGGVIENGCTVDASTASSPLSLGGNVYIDEVGTLNMFGGTIRNGKTTGHGGNVYIAGTFNMSGGEISGGKAGYNPDGTLYEGQKSWRYGGNVALKSGAKFTITGGVIKDGNARIGGNMFINGLFTASDCEITGGVANSSQGGNIYADVSSQMSLTNVVLSGGESKSSGKNLFTQGKALTMVGCTVEGGTGASSSASVYVNTKKGVQVVVDNCTIKDAESVNANQAGLVVLYSDTSATATPDEGTLTITDSVIETVYFDTTKLTLSGKNTIGSETKPGLVLSKEALGENVFVESLDAASKIYVTTSYDGTVVKNGAANIDSFVSTNSEKELTADGDAIVIGTPVVQEHIHCVCGNGDAAGEHHECDDTVVWTPWTDTTTLPTEAGNYYLTADVTTSAITVLKTQSDIRLCLNGHQVNSTGVTRTFSTYDSTAKAHGSDIKFTVTDCQETPGTITGGKANNVNNGAILLASGTNTANFYRVTVTAAADTYTARSGGLFSITNGATLNLYNGTITGGLAKDTGTAVYGGNIYVNGAGATFNMYGGTVSNGKVVSEGQTAAGGNIDVRNSGTVNLYGGTVTGGIAEGKSNTYGGNIFVTYQTSAAQSGTLNYYGGTVTNGTAKNGGGNIATNSANALNLLGTVEITGGKNQSGEDSNVYLLGTSLISLGTSFATRVGAPVGIAMKTPGTFTVNAGNAADFVSEIAGFKVEKNADGTLKFGSASPLSGVALSQNQAVLTADRETMELTVSLSPAGSAYESVTWTAENDSIVGVTQSTTDPLKATVKMNGAGSTKVTVSVKQAGNDTPFTDTVEIGAVTAHNHAIATVSDMIAGTKAATTDWVKVSTEAELKAQLVKSTTKHIYIGADMNLTTYIDVAQNQNLTICLNGHTLTAGTDKRLIRTYQTGSSLTICDCSGDHSGTMQGKGTSDQGAVIWAPKGNLTLYGGTITGGTSTHSLGGGNIYIGNGYTFTMYDGVVSDGKVDVSNSAKPASFRGGVGGNIAVYGSFVMKGGVVKNGSAPATADGVRGFGGNVFVCTSYPTTDITKDTLTYLNNVSCTIEGGTIENGTAAKGANLYVQRSVKENADPSLNVVYTPTVKIGGTGKVVIAGGKDKDGADDDIYFSEGATLEFVAIGNEAAKPAVIGMDVPGTFAMTTNEFIKNFLKAKNAGMTITFAENKLNME